MLLKKARSVLPIGMYGHALHLFEAIRTIPAQHMKLGLRFFGSYQGPNITKEPFHSLGIRQPVECTYEEKTGRTLSTLLFCGRKRTSTEGRMAGHRYTEVLECLPVHFGNGNQCIEQSCLLQLELLEPFA